MRWPVWPQVLTSIFSDMSVYDGASPLSVAQARLRLEKLIDQGKTFEIKDMSRRSTRQNSYLHLIIGWFCQNFGYKSKEDVERIKKRHYKVECNYDLYVVSEGKDKLTGETLYECRSSADLTTEEMTLSITRFRNWASQEWGVYLPSPDEQSLLAEMEKDMAMLRQSGWIDY